MDAGRDKPFKRLNQASLHGPGQPRPAHGPPVGRRLLKDQMPVAVPVLEQIGGVGCVHRHGKAVHLQRRPLALLQQDLQPSDGQGGIVRVEAVMGGHRPHLHEQGSGPAQAGEVPAGVRKPALPTARLGERPPANLRHGRPRVDGLRQKFVVERLLAVEARQ